MKEKPRSVGNCPVNPATQIQCSLRDGKHTIDIDTPYGSSIWHGSKEHGDRHGMTVVWDEDYDDRIFGVLEKWISDCPDLYWSIDIIGETKGTLLIWTRTPAIYKGVVDRGILMDYDAWVIQINPIQIRE